MRMWTERAPPRDPVSLWARCFVKPAPTAWMTALVWTGRLMALVAIDCTGGIVLGMSETGGCSLGRYTATTQGFYGGDSVVLAVTYPWAPHTHTHTHIQMN